MTISLDFASLHELYRRKEIDPVGVVEIILEKIEAADDHNIWISRLPRSELLEQAKVLSQRDADAIKLLPLYGLPFAVKDCIDVAGQPTTAACPEFAYTPERSAPSVSRLLAAGAIYVGKTNLDQFATGLVGVRSPYGVPKNPFNEDFIPGGSSSGSAVAVASGLVSFALGTDTGGSGRVPASYTNTVGLKPTVHRISSRGMTHACRSIDVVSIYALTAGDAAAVLAAAEGPDPLHAWSRHLAHSDARKPVYQPGRSFIFGVPRDDQLAFFESAASEQLYGEAITTLEALGGERVEIDYGPFLEANEMMFQGPFVAERLASVGDFLENHPDAGDPTVRKIVLDASRFSATDAFAMTYRLKELHRDVAPLWERIDVLLLPTVGRPYTIADLQADPVGPNFNNGYYTNFANPLDLAAIALPNGVHPAGVPMGITLNGPAFSEDYLVGLGTEFQKSRGQTLGATGAAIPS